METPRENKEVDGSREKKRKKLVLKRRRAHRHLGTASAGVRGKNARKAIDFLLIFLSRILLTEVAYIRLVYRFRFLSAFLLLVNSILELMLTLCVCVY